jgi:hypothetical protein
MGDGVSYRDMHDGQEVELGTCPICNTSIDERRCLVEYERAESKSTFAECPDCLNIVHPE